MQRRMDNSSTKMDTPEPNSTTTSTEVATSDPLIMCIDNIPIEELLGSVTTYNNSESDTPGGKGQQLRTSARVIKKMKLDSVQAAPTVLEKEKKEPVKEEKPEAKKQYRPMWSQEDKNFFFEALNDCGKDFDAIHTHISTKFKKKGFPESLFKTRDQIRHLYYRTWHKVCKHLKLSDDIKKPAQELYALINYGEMRKKLGAVSEKNCMKLNELIYRGTIAIKSKGKTIRIKTPMCRALRKLNQLDENHDDLKLPTRVTVELIPRDMETWHYVQGIAQNPRAKIVLPLQKRISNLLTCMSCRWRTQISTAHDELLKSASALSSDCIPEEKDIKEQKTKLNPILRFSPPNNSNIELPTINLSEYLTSHRICLNAYEERIGVKIPGEQLWQSMCASFKGGGKSGSKKSGTKRSRHESTGEKLANSLIQAAQKVQQHVHVEESAATIIDTQIVKVEGMSTVSDGVEDAVNTILALQCNNDTTNSGNKVGDEEDKSERIIKEESIKNEIIDDIENKANLKNEQEVFRIKSGWTLENCGNLTIGELYLMYGRDSTVILEYSWDDPNLTLEHEPDTNTVIKQTPDSSKVITNTLKRLLSVAKLHYRKNMIHCPCGHVCGNHNKSSPYRNKTPINIIEKPSDTNLNNERTTNSMTSPKIRQLPMSAVFRTPRIVTPPSTEDFRQQLDSIQRMRPRFCNRRGRPRGKQVVVERKLPLLPKPMINGHSIVTMKVISQDTKPMLRNIAPKVDVMEQNKIPPVVTIVSDSVNIDKELLLTESNASPVINNICNNMNVIGSTASGTTDMNVIEQPRVSSPSSISNLLELALPSGILPDTESYPPKENVTSFAGFLSQDIENSTPPTSPSRILKENDNHWLSSEVADFSLSSFLGQLESPMKPQTVAAPSEDGRLCQDVDVQLQSLLTESSIDYMAKFADLAAQVSDNPKT